MYKQQTGFMKWTCVLDFTSFHTNFILTLPWPKWFYIGFLTLVSRVIQNIVYQRIAGCENSPAWSKSYMALWLAKGEFYLLSTVLLNCGMAWHFFDNCHWQFVMGCHHGGTICCNRVFIYGKFLAFRHISSWRPLTTLGGPNIIK